jgi:hypothetical protein
MNLNQFAIKIDRSANLMPKSENAHVRAVFLLVDQAVVLATPVDTGRARSNWRASNNAPISTTIAPYAPGNRLGLGEGANAAAAMAQARAAAAARKSGETMYITNNLPYIELLNANYSPQAPSRYVEQAIQAGLVAAAKRKFVVP